MPSFQPAMNKLQHKVANCILALSFMAGVVAGKVVDCARLGCSLFAAALVSTYSTSFPSSVAVAAGVAGS